jgi:hypothetical protein
MSLLPLPRTAVWMLRDTWRQSLASGIFWILLAGTLICLGLCASMRIENAASLSFGEEAPDFLPANDPDARDPEKLRTSGVSVVRGQTTLLWGAIRIPLARDARATVHHVQLVLALGVADTLGLLLALIWTAGFLPSFFDPRSASVLLCKPPSRTRLLLYKYASVVAVVGLHAVVLVGGTWLLLGVKTGVWDRAYLWAIPLLVLQFAVFFAFSALLASSTRSTVVCVLGTVMFWAVCWAMNYGYHALHARAADGNGGVFGGGVEQWTALGYWLLPKPADASLLLYEKLDALRLLRPPEALAQVLGEGGVRPWLSVAASLGFMAVALAAACREFATADY